MSDACGQMPPNLCASNLSWHVTFQTGLRSVTFDPIMYLTLPVPKPPHSVSVTVVPADYPRAPLQSIDLEVRKRTAQVFLLPVG